MTIWTDMLDTPFEIGPVMAGGVRTRSLRAGSGEPVIFLHGVSGHLECFTKTIPEHAKHFSVHAIDLLGAGFTDQLTEPTTIPALSKHVLDYMDALDIESAHLVAISVGGWVAGWTAAEHPDRVKNLTLVIPAGVKPVAARHNLLLESTIKAATTADRELTRERLNYLMADPARVTEELVDIRYRIYQQPGFVTSAENFFAAAGPIQLKPYTVAHPLNAERLQKITAETLVIWGRHNKQIETGEYAAEHIKKSQFLLFDDSSHWVPFEEPERFGRVNIPFLQSGLAGIPASERVA